MWVTRALKTTQIAHLFVGISVHEASHLKGGVYSFPTVTISEFTKNRSVWIGALDCFRNRHEMLDLTVGIIFECPIQIAIN